MQPFHASVMHIRKAVWLLRLDKDRLTHAHETEKHKVDQTEKRIKEQTQRIKELERENERLTREAEQSKKTKNRCQVALFDPGNMCADRRTAARLLAHKTGKRGYKSNLIRCSPSNRRASLFGISS